MNAKQETWQPWGERGVMVGEGEKSRILFTVEGEHLADEQRYRDQIIADHEARQEAVKALDKARFALEFIRDEDLVAGEVMGIDSAIVEAAYHDVSAALDKLRGTETT